MDERQKREYQTVVLAALLHDIGKFLNRADVKRKHPLFSADYVSSDEFKKRIGKDWVDFELLKILIQRHHEYTKCQMNFWYKKLKTLVQGHWHIWLAEPIAIPQVKGLAKNHLNWILKMQD